MSVMNLGDRNDDRGFGFCRLCAQSVNAQFLVQICDRIKYHISECFRIEIKECDNLPRRICIRCQLVVSNFHSVLTKYRSEQCFLLSKFENVTESNKQEQTKKQPEHVNISKSSQVNANEKNEELRNNNNDVECELEVVNNAENSSKAIVNSTPKQAKNNSTSFFDKSSNEKKKSLFWATKYNCIFCLQQFNNTFTFKKHIYTSHENLKRQYKKTKPCHIAMEKLQLDDKVENPLMSSWVQLRKSVLHKIDHEIEYCFLSKASYIPNIPDKRFPSDSESDDDFLIRRLSSDLNLQISSDANKTQPKKNIEIDDEKRNSPIIEKEPVKSISDLSNVEMEEDISDDTLNSKDSVCKIALKGFFDYTEKMTNFKTMFLDRIKHGPIDLLWINSETIISMPRFEKNCALKEYSKKENGLCSNMFGLKPYVGKTKNATEMTTGTISLQDNKKVDVKSQSVENSMDNDEKTDGQFPKIIASYSLPVNNGIKRKFPNTNDLTVIKIKKPLIKCKPTALLMANPESSETKKPLTIPVSTIDPKIINVDNESDKPGFSNSNRIMVARIAPFENNTNPAPVILNKQLVSTNNSPSVNNSATTTSFQLSIEDEPVEQNSNKNEVNPALLKLIPKCSTEKQKASVCNKPFVRLLKKMQEYNVLMDVHIKNHDKIEIYLFKFKFIINEKKTHTSTLTFIVTLSLSENGVFILDVINSNGIKVDINQWLDQYQCQLIRAIRQPTVFQSMENYIASTPSYIKLKVKSFLSTYWKCSNEILDQFPPLNK